MPVVENTLTDVAGVPLANVLVQARLVGSTTTTLGGFDTGDSREVGGWLDVRTNAAGRWSLDLEPTVGGDLFPVGVYVEILEHFPEQAPLRHTIAVPTSVGPHWLYDVLTTPTPVAGVGLIWKSGAGTPQGVVTAPIGALFTRTDGGAGTTLYVKESGVGNVGWVPK